MLVSKGPHSRQPGSEPIPGYRLIEPLGKGGFGEVWKCEAPGGLFKAIKFVSNENQSHAVTLEWEALKRVKLIRHPFILSLERVELLDGELLVIMELADHNLFSLHQAYRRRGHAGLPRELLLGFLLEAAEALDWMNFEHQLQHLDIKPHNLFIVSNHLKVADFGLVQQVGGGASESRRLGGVTPLYASPELLRGGFSRTSDQYSLAVVYQQMLTGDVPYWDENLYQLVLLHLTGEPRLASLFEADRRIVARALSRTPEDRFPSCLDFIQALLPAGFPGSPTRSGVRRLSPSHPGVEPLADFPEASTSPSANQPTHASPDVRTGELCGSAGTRSLDTVESLLPESGPTGWTDPAQLLAACLPGFRFLACVLQGTLGDLWQLEDPEGRQKRALALLPTPDPARLAARLKALRHPALFPTEVVEAPGERVLLVFDHPEPTLRERFEQCRASGLPGIPREELLGQLKWVAEALDTISSEHGIPHLGVNPSCLVYREGEVFLADHGLIHLVGIRAGLQPAALNPRFAAPELYSRPASPTSDQYSLALVYTELLTGCHPRPFRPGSGMTLRPTTTGRRSGTIPRPGGERRSGQTQRPIQLDLDLLPPPDREVVARALRSNPEERFPSCTAFVEALEAATVRPEPPALDVRDLPPVVPFTSLQGEPPPEGLVLPRVGQLLRELSTPPAHRSMPGPRNRRYKLHPDGTWEDSCPLQLLPGSLPIKVEGFRLHWKARVVQQEEDHFRLHLDLAPSERFWERAFGPARRLEVEVLVPSLPAAGSRLTEARIYLRVVSGEPVQMKGFLERMAPDLFESLRSYLQARQEQRAGERVPFSRLLHVYPIGPGLELGEVVVGTGLNLSSTGLGFRVPRRLETEWFYLHFPDVPAIATFVLLGQVVRTAAVQDNGYDVAARFLGS
jgi:serine/threonine protein kinase